MDDVKLRERLEQVEATVTAASAQNELVAAVEGSQVPRVDFADGSEPAVELRFTVAESWAQKVLVALLMRRGFRPYRKPGQHATTIMVEAPKAFVSETIMVEYAAITGKLESWIDAVTERVIAEVIHGDGGVVAGGE